MFIKKVILENFRTFYGRHEINFSADENKPVTILIGENGAGKTNLLNAIYWAFTAGFTKQFNSVDPIINKSALEEGIKVCSVEIEFTNDDAQYRLRRVYTHKSSDTELTINEYDSAGSLSRVGNEMAKVLIETLIPKKLASWFIFDGEAIDHLRLDGDPKFRSDIRQTFGFSSLEKLLSTLTEIEREYVRKESKSSNDDRLELLSANIEKNEKELESHDLTIQKLKDTILIEEKKKNDLERRLSEYAQAEPLQARKDRAKRKQDEAMVRKTQKIRLRNEYFIATIPKLLLKERLNKLIEDLNKKEEQQTLPAPLGTKLIEDIKRLQKCICGRPVHPESDEVKHLNDLSERAATSLLMQKIFSFRAEIGDYAKQAALFEEKIRLHEDEVGKCESDIAEQKAIIRKADQDIDGIDDTEVKKIKHEILEAESISKSASEALGYSKSEADRLKRKIPELRMELENILAQQVQTANLRTERQKVAKLRAFVLEQFQRQESEVLDAFNREISGVLEVYLTKRFTAKVDSDTYAVKVYDSNGKIASLSTGESNVLKFAVVAAIVGMAAKRTRISQVDWISQPIIAPLIFDAPFSVVDKDYRAGITKNLSELASQLVLMFDSDKWSDRLSLILKDKIGKSYLLISRADGDIKDIQKVIEINDRTYNLNEYGGVRTETIVKEISL